MANNTKAFDDAMNTVNSVSGFAKDVGATPSKPQGKIVTGPSMPMREVQDQVTNHAQRHGYDKTPM